MAVKTAVRAQTKQTLVDAFWKLYREKGIERITVGEIAATAGYNRSTFYEYFSDVPEMLRQIEDAILEEMQFGIPDDEKIPIDEVVAIFERNADALSLLLGEHGDFSFFFRVRGRMKDAFHALAKQNGVEVDFGIALEIEYHVAGTTASMLSWLRMPDRPSAEPTSRRCAPSTATSRSACSESSPPTKSDARRTASEQVGSPRRIFGKTEKLCPKR